VTDSIDEALAQVGLGLLRADAGLTVYDGRVPDGSVLPYVLVYTTVSWPPGAEGNTLTGKRVTASVEWTCHCVAGTASGARVVQQRVRVAFLNQTGAVANRQCGLIKQDEVRAPDRDETTGQLVMDGVSVYSLLSTP
jgi:hypothetical protein